jgi:putative endonuclease
MKYFVCIIQSLKDNSYYKGYSENPARRLVQHNNAESNYTSAKMPWQLVHVESFHSKKEALIKEKALKKYSHTQIVALIQSLKNIVSKFEVG